MELIMGQRILLIVLLLYITTLKPVLNAPSTSVSTSTTPSSTTSSSSTPSSSIPTSSSTESLVVTSPKLPVEITEPTKNADMQDKVPKLPKIYSMKVNTNVTNRFAKTLVTSKVRNLDEKSQEVTFSVVLPETAYISGFIMEIDGKMYEAYVKEKQEAKQIYDNAVSSGLAAGHVELSARDSNRFTVSVNIEPQSKAVFYLTYEELLKRQRGAYDIIVNLHPGQPVKDLAVEVNINETRPLSFVKAPSLRSGNEISKNDEKLNPKAKIEQISKTEAKVTFEPDLERQKELGTFLGNKEGTGLAGQFIVQYDVERDPTGGEVLVSDGYFVHFFAPNELKPLEKHVVFVLDTSGSMSGIRIQQLKQAMKSILGQLHKEDSLNIIDFNSVVNVWNIPKVEVQYVEGDFPEYFYVDSSNNPPKKKTNQSLPDAFDATEDNIEHAEKVIEKLDAYGGTDIKSSLVVALQLLNKTKPQRSNSKQPIIIFLTDGEATVGEFGDEAINSVTTANTDGVPIFCLSFGDGADRAFLEKISLKNQGFARHIYEGADASLQLEEFYEYVSSPLLTKVNFKYVSKTVSKLTKTAFPIIFEGSEIVVAGKIDPATVHPIASESANCKEINGTSVDCNQEQVYDLVPEVDAWGVKGPIDLKPKVANSLGSLEKHWAYLTLKQLLDERDAVENKSQYTKKALEIALKYSFVTPVSSLVVVKPNNTKDEAIPEDASKSHIGFDSFAYATAVRPGVAHFILSDPVPLGMSYEAADTLIEPHMNPDRIYGSAIKPTISEISTTEVINPLDTLKQNLPWLNDVLDQNETLTLPNGKYKLGVSDIVNSGPECTSAPLNGTGVCTLLKDCPQVHSLLVDLKTFTDHFCPLNEFAGICCPTKKTTER